MDYSFHMESNPHPSPRDAAEQLRSYDGVRAKVPGPPRAFLLLGLWAAVILAVYVGVFLLSLGGRPLNAAAPGPVYFSYVTIILFPVLVFSSVVAGARERFGIRTKPTLRYRIAYVLVCAGFITLGWLSIAGVPYPWGLNLLLPLLLFLTMAAGPIRQLLRKSATGQAAWINKPLSRPARWSTAAIGAVSGLLVGTAASPQWFSIVSLAVTLALVVVLIGWRARWGLPWTGYEWGPIHWIAFGISTSVLFLVFLLLSRTDLVTLPISIAAGGFVLLVMLTASFLPARPRRG
ncbi:hypothetical protein BH11ACT4_BH11ACT4_15400 [soil metagenome]